MACLGLQGLSESSVSTYLSVSCKLPTIFQVPTLQQGIKVEEESQGCHLILAAQHSHGSMKNETFLDYRVSFVNLESSSTMILAEGEESNYCYCLQHHKSWPNCSSSLFWCGLSSFSNGGVPAHQTMTSPSQCSLQAVGRCTIPLERWASSLPIGFTATVQRVSTSASSPAEQFKDIASAATMLAITGPLLRWL